MTPPWRVERSTGAAGDFHARPLPGPGPGDGERVVRVLDVDRGAVVLGSTQPESDVDQSAVTSAGFDVVRRRSGGGAVLLEPGGTMWVDVDLPAGDPLWEDDVAEAFLWLGDAWAGAWAALGVDARVHRGRLVSTRWSRLVCFAGTGPGEVLVGGRKSVGIAQRRTRHAARFQCAALRRWEPGRLLDLLALTPEERSQAAEDLGPMAAGVDRPADDVVDALLSVLPGRH